MNYLRIADWCLRKHWKGKTNVSLISLFYNTVFFYFLVCSAVLTFSSRSAAVTFFLYGLGNNRGSFQENVRCEDKSPKVNWLHHVKAHDNFACQEKFLSSNFLFSLPAQKPSDERMHRTRSLFRHAPILFSLSLCRYLRYSHDIKNFNLILQVLSRVSLKKGIVISIFIITNFKIANIMFT